MLNAKKKKKGSATCGKLLCSNRFATTCRNKTPQVVYGGMLHLSWMIRDKISTFKRKYVNSVTELLKRKEETPLT